jgi:hypothetical protein
MIVPMSIKSLSQFQVWHGLPAREYTGKMPVPHNSGIGSKLLRWSFPSFECNTHSFGITRQDAGGTAIADPLIGFGVQVTERSAQSVFGALRIPLVFRVDRADSEHENGGFRERTQWRRDED